MNAAELVENYRAVSTRLRGPMRVNVLTFAPVPPLRIEPRLVYPVAIGPTVSFYPPMTLDQEARAISAGHRPGKSKQIIADVCMRHTVSINDLKSPCREARIVRARQEAIYLLRENTLLSFPQIAAIFNRDHTTCIHAYQKLRAERVAHETAK
jgi:hypothetical protein